MNFAEFEHWLHEASDQLDHINPENLPLEAELHYAICRNKMIQLLSVMPTFRQKVREAQYHYHTMFEILFDHNNTPHVEETTEEDGNGEETR